MTFMYQTNSMKYRIVSILLFASSFSVFAQKKENVLVGTKWKFIGLLSNSSGTLRTCPNYAAAYTIYFTRKHKFSGIATLHYEGRYKIKKNNRIKIRVFISKGSLLGKPDADEFECRLNYGKYLGGSETFSVQNGKMEIKSGPYTTMVFESAN